MTTRRNFLKAGTAAATGIVFCSCGLLEHARAQGAPRATLPVSINGKIFRDSWGEKLPETAEIYLLPRIAGG